MNSKSCNICLIKLPITSFGAGYAKCRDCDNAQRRTAYKENPSRKLYNDQYRKDNFSVVSAYMWKYYVDNEQEIKKYLAQYYIDNHTMILRQKSIYAKQNRPRLNALGAKRRAAYLNRIPSWLTKSDWIEIKWAYQLAKELTAETGIVHVVDHIVPLQGKNISGLHCPQNLKIITHAENSSKKNKFPYTYR